MAGPLNHSPADILSRVLIDLTLGKNPPATPWPVYVGVEAANPDAVITVFDTTGVTGPFTWVDNDRSIMHGYQVRVRAATHPVGYLKTNQIAEALDAVNDVSVTIDGYVYLVECAPRTGDVMVLGLDPNTKRNLFTVNGTMTVRRTATP